MESKDHPQDVWYLIPAAIILGPTRKTGLMLSPMEPLKKDRYKYEAYKEAWDHPLQKPPGAGREISWVMWILLLDDAASGKGTALSACSERSRRVP